VSTTWQTVHVRVNDEATGQPTPVRIRITGPDGQYFAPLGRLPQFATGRNEDVGGNVLLGMKPHAYIDGTCEINLPPGPLLVEVSKGPEYTPLCQEVVVKPGQLSLRFNLARWVDLRARGWYAGDARAHFLTPHGALLEGAAEDLAVVNLLATNCRVPGTHGKDYAAIPNLLAFSGQGPALQAPGHLVVVNTLNTHPLLGSLGLLNCHRVVYPLQLGGPDGRDDWTLADWCDQCHRKGGLVVWCDPYRPEAGLPGGEALANAILGKVDAIEVDALDRTAPFLPLWYRLLNAGVRLPLVGGSGKDSNRVALGGVRTLTPRVGSGSYAEWVEQVKSGRTIAANGPYLRFTVNDEPWPTRVANERGQPLRLAAAAESIVPFERLELIANGVTVATVAPSKSDVFRATVEHEHKTADGWLAARCWGAAKSDLYPHVPVFPHTSPVWLETPGRPNPRTAAALEALKREIEGVRLWVERDGRFTNPRRKEHLLALCDSAVAKLACPP